MSAYSIPPLVSSILFFSLGLFCYLKNKKSKVNISFALMCLTTVWWQGSWAVLFNVKDPSIASFLVRFGYIGITFIPITFYHFTIEFLNRQEEKKLVWLSYLIGAFLVIMLWATDLYIRGYYVFYWGYYPKAGLLFHPIYLAMLSIQALRMLYLLYINLKYKLLDPIKRNQIKYMFWAIFFYTFASADFADNYGLEIYPLGFIPILIFMAIIGHTIARYRLLDINFVIRKIIAYAGVILLLAGFVAGIYLLHLSENTKLLLYFVTASVFTVLSPKIITRTESAVNNILYKGKYDYIDKFETFIDNMPFIPIEKDLFRNIVKNTTGTLGVKKMSVFIFDTISSSYRLQEQEGGLDNIKEFNIPSDNGLINWLKENREVFVREEMAKVLRHSGLSVIEEILNRLSASICVPVILRENLVGIITLGEKSSGEMYSHIDLKILHRLGTMLALSLNHIWIIAELHKEKEQATVIRNRLNAISSMALGLADRINNYIFAANAFFGEFPKKLEEFGNQLTPEQKESLIALYSSSAVGVDKIKNLSREMGGMGLPPKYNFQKYEPKIIMDIADEESMDLKSDMESKDIKIEKIIEGNPPATYFDKDAIKKVLFHLMQNSIHAIYKSKKGIILIKVTGPILKSGREFIRIIIEDNGIGIPKENMENIFNPFFTTKGTAGGRGLGLTICQFIVTQHDGEIGVIRSELYKGTTMYIDLPIKKDPPKNTLDYKDILGQFPARRK